MGLTETRMAYGGFPICAPLRERAFPGDCQLHNPFVAFKVESPLPSLNTSLPDAGPFLIFVMRGISRRARPTRARQGTLELSTPLS